MLDAIDLPTVDLPVDGPAHQPDFIARLTELMLKQRSLLFQTLLGSAAFICALYLRFAVDGSLPPGFPFLTFIPAVLIVSVLAGVRAGTCVAVVSGLAAWYFFIAPVYSLILTPASATAMLFYILIMSTQLVLITAVKLALLRLRASEQRSTDLAQSRALMFSELQHRVSNNLAVVAALLRLQGGRTTDPQAKQVLSDAQVRINTIARLQRRLHSPNLQSVAVADFIRDMAEDTISVAGAGAGVVLQFDLQPVQVTHDRAVPLGLIVSELLMNAVEHSLGEGGSIHISMRTDADSRMVTLTVQDSGRGLPDDFDIAHSKSLGLSIARQFATQLRGDLALMNGPGGGTLARLQFQN